MKSRPVCHIALPYSNQPVSSAYYIFETKNVDLPDLQTGWHQVCNYVGRDLPHCCASEYSRDFVPIPVV